MKNLLLVLSFLSVIGLNAQNAPIDFESGGYGADWTWTVFENNTNPPVEIIANPDMSGINTSATVAKITALQSGQPWAGCESLHGADIGSFTFTEDNATVKVMVWKSVISDCGIKFAEANGEAQPEVKVANTLVNQWEELSFDLSGSIGAGITGIIDQIIFFPDFDLAGRTQDNVVYFDNITFSPANGSGGKPYLALDVQDNFENDGYGTITDWKFQDPELMDLMVTEDPMNASNHVANYNRSGTFEWTNAQFILDHRMDLTTRHTFALRVYFPSSNDYTGNLTPTAAIKLQNSLLGGDAWTTQTEIKLDVTQFDTWVNLEFDFVSVSGRTDYDQVVVQLGGEGHFVPGTMYFDDLVLANPTSVNKDMLSQTTVYPNPAGDVLYLKDAKNLTSVSIFSVTGQLVYQSATNNNSVDVSSLQSGLYTLRAIGDDGKTYVAKFVVK